MPGSSYVDSINRRRDEYHSSLATAEFFPYVFPINCLGHALLVWRLTSIRKWSLHSRFFVVSIIMAHSLFLIRWSRSIGLASGVVIGIAGVWSILITCNMLLIHNPRTSFRRMILSSPHPKDHVLDNQINGAGQQGIERQSMPTETLPKIFWALDLLGSLRLLHWSHNASTVQPTQSIAIITSDQSQYSSAKTCTIRLCLVYLAIDVLKEIVAVDPYFWGSTSAALPEQIQSMLPLPGLGHAFRMIIALVLIYLAIALVTTTGQIVFIHILGPRVAGTWGQVWAYQPQNGHVMSIYTKGLRGFWGEYWHQMFRQTLTSIATFLVQLLRLPNTGLSASCVRLFVPFILSGLIHAGGSFTMCGETQPSCQFLFFLIQPLGIILQLLCNRIIENAIAKDKTRYHVLGISNVAFAMCWFLLTFPLLADDFAHGGLWLSEPFPISLMQVLGVGSKERSHPLWLDWGVSWHMGRRWWQSGLAV